MKLSSFFSKAFSLAAILAVSAVLLNQGSQWLASQEEPAWGGEALSAVSENVQKISPVALANACGLGASSCFRCHNGKRADAPSKDAATAPWHVDHDKVNYSCAGCHAGNPRILKQEIAHKGLIANPVANAEASCQSCHGADTAATTQVYLDKHPKLGGEEAAE